MVDKSVRIEVTGARELRRAVKKAQDDGLTKELKGAYRDAAKIVTSESKQNVPVLSGDLRSSIRPLGGTASAQVAAGRGRTRDYAGVIHFGWPAHNIKPHPFIHDAISTEWDRIYKAFENAIDDVIKQI